MRAGAFLLLAFPLVVVAYQGLPIGGRQLSPLVRASVVAVFLAGLTQTLLRREQRSLADYGVSFSWRFPKELGVGFVAGCLLSGLGVVGLRAALPFEWALSPTISVAAMAGAAGYHLITAACEELAWRGVAFDSLIRSIGFWPAQLLVALVAACFHVVCGWTWGVALLSTTAGSVLFGLVFFRWRSLPAAIGVHGAWNWTRDLLFGPATAASLLTARGTEAWTSVEWGVAQGILVAVTWVAALLLVRLRSPNAIPNAPTASLGSSRGHGP